MAAGKPAIQVTGAKELRSALKRMGADLSDLRAINLSAAKVVAADAKARAPRRSGALANSIRPLATRTTGSVAAGRTMVPYAGPIHFGWPARNIEPQPFLYEALDNRSGEVVQKYEDEVARLVTRVGRETP